MVGSLHRGGGDGGRAPVAAHRPAGLPGVLRQRV